MTDISPRSPSTNIQVPLPYALGSKQQCNDAMERYELDGRRNGL